MIIVEGPDGAGKSTLCRELASEFHVPIHIKEPKDGPTNARENTYEALQRAVSWDESIRIYDRLYFSELVYGSILRDKVDFSPKEQLHIEGVLLGLKCPIIFCDLPRSLLRSNVEADEEGQLMGVRENLDKISLRYHQIYRRLYEQSKVLYEYDYTGSIDNQKHAVFGAVEAYLTFRGAGADGRTA